MSEKNIKLVIAEKPSVAQSIAKVIGAEKREDGYLEGNGYIVGFARTGVVTETVERKGIGTSATRAATIEKLVRDRKSTRLNSSHPSSSRMPSSA